MTSAKKGGGQKLTHVDKKGGGGCQKNSTMSIQSAIRLPPLPTIQEIIRIYGLSARKQLSQNFLLDLNLTNKIVKSAGSLHNGFVIEVGPGPGGITRSVLNSNAEKLLVIEKDRRFLTSLEILSKASKGRLEVLHGDILRYDLDPLIPEIHKSDWFSKKPNIHLIGNLPFNIATPLIIQWLEEISLQKNAWRFGRVPLTLTFQKEVAERIIAPPMSEHRCRLSVMCQTYCHVKMQFIIPGQAFVPAPKVDVGVVHFIPRKKPIIKQPFIILQKLNRHLFNLPNKHCRNPIKTLFPQHREDLVCDMFEHSGVNPESRPFELLNEEIGRLCNVYAQLINKEPELLNYDFRSKKEAKIRRRKNSLIIKSLEDDMLQTRQTS